MLSGPQRIAVVDKLITAAVAGRRADGQFLEIPAIELGPDGNLNPPPSDRNAFDGAQIDSLPLQPTGCDDPSETL